METLLGKGLEKKSNREMKVDKLLVKGVFISSYMSKLNMPIEVDRSDIIEILLGERLGKEWNGGIEAHKLLAEEAFILSYILE